MSIAVATETPDSNDSYKGIMIQVDVTRYQVLIWLLMDQHKCPLLKRNENHLRFFDAMSQMKPDKSGVTFLKLDRDLIPLFYTSLTQLESYGIQQLVNADMPLNRIILTHGTITQLIESIEPYYLEEIYKDQKANGN